MTVDRTRIAGSAAAAVALGIGAGCLVRFAGQHPAWVGLLVTLGGFILAYREWGYRSLADPKA